MSAVNIATITTVNRVRFYVGQPGTSEGTVYTVAASTNAKISQIVLCNTSNSPASLSLSVVPSGGSAGATNRIISGLSLDANSTTTLDMSVFMDTGDFISAIQTVSGAITAYISGETYA
jgi:hypothetical protein